MLKKDFQEKGTYILTANVTTDFYGTRNERQDYIVIPKGTVLEHVSYFKNFYGNFYIFKAIQGFSGPECIKLLPCALKYLELSGNTISNFDKRISGLKRELDQKTQSAESIDKTIQTVKSNYIDEISKLEKQRDKLLDQKKGIEDSLKCLEAYKTAEEAIEDLIQKCVANPPTSDNFLQMLKQYGIA